MSSSPREKLVRLLPTLTWIETHLDADLSLASLAAVSGLSRHHFHRLFRRTIGETPRQYIERLRLERSAFLLTLEQRTVLDIALDVGFRSHEAFTRAFRRHFDATPSDFRRQERSHASPLGRRDPRGLEAEHPTGELSATRIRVWTDVPLAFIRHHGAYEDVPATLWDKLLSWATDQGLASSPSLLLGIGHDSPSLTAPEKLRFDACVRVKQQFRASGPIGCQVLAAGEYAMATHVGPYRTLPAAWAGVLAWALSLRGYQTPTLPVVEIYQATRITPEHSLNRTELCIPLQRIGE